MREIFLALIISASVPFDPPVNQTFPCCEEKLRRLITLYSMSHPCRMGLNPAALLGDAKLISVELGWTYQRYSDAIGEQIKEASRIHKLNSGLACLRAQMFLESFPNADRLRYELR